MFASVAQKAIRKVACDVFLLTRKEAKNKIIFLVGLINKRRERERDQFNLVTNVSDVTRFRRHYLGDKVSSSV